ncbi:MAG: M20/M25/M40 family metallo-hydrolase [Ktedonobacterales bacterium]|nr:M20/M25/M40 family metallo-hydrolase [Ktedonobacterales bacterium]
MLHATDAATIYQRPEELLQRLLRFDTTNPPGNEAACAADIRALLMAVGIEATLIARDPARPNLIARLPGRGDAPPLLLYGHVDVVTTEGQRWTHPPFAGEIADGCVWGRGALDMKGGVAMLLAAFLRARAEGATLPGDVLFVALADEEVHSEYGAHFLVTEHPDLFAGVRYALGEIGGFTSYLGQKMFYPIMVAEKRYTQLRATVRGPGGHGSLPMRGGTVARLARFLRRLDQRHLPVHVTPPVREMIEAIAAALPLPAALPLRALLTPALTDYVLALLGPQGAPFDPLLHNTANATMIHGGEKVNVVPSAITVEMDGRLVPGGTAEDLRAEVQTLAGGEIEVEIIYREDGATAPHAMGLYPTLANILRRADPEGIPIPMVLGAVTDGRFFSQLGIQTYGYLPMKLPRDFEMISLVHAADERVPTEALAFGTDAIYQALLRFGEAT